MKRASKKEKQKVKSNRKKKKKKKKQLLLLLLLRLPFSDLSCRMQFTGRESHLATCYLLMNTSIRLETKSCRILPSTYLTKHDMT